MYVRREAFTTFSERMKQYEIRKQNEYVPLLFDPKRPSPSFQEEPIEIIDSPLNECHLNLYNPNGRKKRNYR